jgi:predicted RNase H-like HicB family nuclease
MKKLKFTIVFIKEEEGGFTVIVEELPGAISYGKTLKEARKNILEAIQLVLESNRDLAERKLAGKYLQKEMLCFA